MRLPALLLLVLAACTGPRAPWVGAPADSPGTTDVIDLVDVIADSPVDVAVDVAVAVADADSSSSVAVDLVDAVGNVDVNVAVDVAVNDDGWVEVTQNVCDGVDIGCQGNAWITCDPVTGAVFGAVCTTSNPCVETACQPEVGCVEAPVICDDGDPCTVDSCLLPEGCVHDPVGCPDGQSCVGGLCTCPVACPGLECGTDPCGTVCGLCDPWEACSEGTCVATYPAPPYGAWIGNIVANHAFTDPTDLSEVTLSEWWGEGQLLLLDFSAGWCIVCKNDTAVFNEWVGNCYDDGLRVIQVLYENPDQTPATAAYANGWKQLYDTQYTVLIDSATTGPDGEAEGGVLPTFLQPNGPGQVGFMPIPMLIDTATMQILYLDTGMDKPLFHALITSHLGVSTCWD